MTPNVARFLRRYGVDKEIGENLVPFKELHMRKTDGTKIGYALISKVEQVAGARWWVVHRYEHDQTVHG
jgi:salicylate hydroxylase